MMLSVNFVTNPVNAVPMTTATDRSTMLPLARNSLKPFNMRSNPSLHRVLADNPTPDVSRVGACSGCGRVLASRRISLCSNGKGAMVRWVFAAVAGAAIGLSAFAIGTASAEPAQPPPPGPVPTSTSDDLADMVMDVIQHDGLAAPHT